MTPLDAVAAAIRERLLDGRPAPLPGLGTLVRTHVAARVEERPDGSRVLLPPGDTIGLSATSGEHESLASSFARFRGDEDGQEGAAYQRAMEQIEGRLAATGEVRLPGVGLLRRTSGGVVLGVEADLLAAVNRTYEGLPPVGAGGAVPADEPEDVPADESADAPADAPPFAFDDEASDRDSDDTPDPDSDDTPAQPSADASSEPSPDPSAVDSMDTPPAPAGDLGEETPQESASQPPAWGAVPSASDASLSASKSLSASNQTPAPESASDPSATLSPEPADTAPPSAPEPDASSPEPPGDAVAVPFGDPPADVLPPTPPDADPSVSADSLDAGSDIWTAPSSAPAPSLDSPSRSDDDAPPSIEDAEFSVVGDARMGPDAEMDALLAAPDSPPPGSASPSTLPAESLAADPFAAAPADDAGTAQPLPTEPPVVTVVEDPEPRKKGFPWGWTLLFVLFGLLGFALVWYWPAIQGAAEGITAPDAPAVESTPPPAVAPAPDDALDSDAPTDDVPLDSTVVGADAEAPPSAPPALDAAVRLLLLSS